MVLQVYDFFRERISDGVLTPWTALCSAYRVANYLSHVAIYNALQTIVCGITLKDYLNQHKDTGWSETELTCIYNILA